MTPEILVKAAWNDLKNNQLLLAVYLAAQIALACAYIGLDRLIFPEEPPSPAPLWLPAARFFQQLCLASIVAALQSIVFARFGKAIDLPLWKCRTDGEALRRFFLLWAFVNLAYITLDQLASQAYRAEAVDLAYGLVMLIFMYHVLVFPLAVCVMYAGRFATIEPSDVFAPITRHFGLAAVVFLVLSMSFMFYFGMAPAALNQEPLPRVLVGVALLTLLLALVELFAFAAIWRLCMLHRDTAYQDNDDSEPF